jgi:hypothetical protein
VKLELAWASGSFDIDLCTVKIEVKRLQARELPLSEDTG